MTDNDLPLVTVIMPAYNAGAFISESIVSVLAQEGVSFELLVIDDCSTDDTVARMMAFDDPRIRIVRMDVNLGVSVVTNKGLNLARGRYYARLDADDLMLPGRLARQVAFMESHPQVGCCGGAVEVFGEGLEPYLATYPQSDSAIRCAMLLGNPFAHSALMVRMGLVRQHSLAYDETLRHAEDYDFIEHLSQCTMLANLPFVIAKYRRHVGQVTERQGHVMREKRSLVRSRYVRRVFPRLSPEQLALHDIVAETDLAVDRTALPSIEKLLLHYVDLGAEEAGVHGQDLERAVATKWLNVCFRTSLGLKDLCRYFISDLRLINCKFIKLEFILSIKFIKNIIY